MHLIQKIAFFCLRSFVKGFFVVSSFVSSLVKRVCPFVIVKFRTFFWKNPLSGKNDQKWSKMVRKQGLWTFWENHVIGYVWKWCKMEVPMFLLTFCRNCMSSKSVRFCFMKNSLIFRENVQKLDTIRKNLFCKTRCFWVTESQK